MAAVPSIPRAALDVLVDPTAGVAPPAAPRPRALVLDDDVAVATVVQHVVRLAGYEALLARNGADVLRRLQTESFDLLVTDIYMPDTDGLELIRLVRSRHPRLRIIAISGGGEYGFSPLKVAGLMGAAGVLEKPFEIAALTALLHASRP